MGTMASTVGSCHKEGGGYSPGSSASANGGRNNGGGRNEYEDEDDEDLEDGIHVDHEWSVENGEKGNNSPRTSRYEATEANRYDPRGSKFVANAQHSV